MRKFKIHANGYTYERITWEMDLEANSVADAVALSQSPDHHWEFVEGEIMETNLPEITGYYEGEGDWMIWEVLPDGTEKLIEGEEADD